MSTIDPAGILETKKPETTKPTPKNDTYVEKTTLLQDYTNTRDHGNVPEDLCFEVYAWNLTQRIPMMPTYYLTGLSSPGLTEST